MTKDQLVDALSELTVMEMADLKTALEDKWGVTAAAAAPAMVMAPAAGGEAEAAEEATEFNVVLEDVPAAKKIAVIKVIREATGLGLKEAKEMAESAPKNVKENAPKAEAEEVVKKLTDAGAKASMKGV